LAPGKPLPAESRITQIRPGKPGASLTRRMAGERQ